jgi:Zn-dependent protease
MDRLKHGFLKFALGKLTIFTFFGIPLKISGAFVLFVILLCALQIPDGWERVRLTFAILMIVYLVVIPHEYGHALMAKRFGYKCKDITLWPYAGAASIQGKWYKNPKHELLIALAGPAVNIAVVLSLIWFIPLNEEVGPGMLALGLYVLFSLFLGAFNLLLPLYPMDGGRIVRAFCVMGKGDVLKGNDLAKMITWVTLAFLAPVFWMYWSPVVAIILFVIVVVGLGEMNIIRAQEYEEISRIFVREEEIIEGYRTQAEKLPEGERENYMQEMAKFHSWIHEVFTIHVQLIAQICSDKEEAMKLIDERWKTVITFISSLEGDRLWDFHCEFIDVDDDLIRREKIRYFLKGVCYAPGV